ncbi:MAG: motility associated factor glycosyltransferase family protein [Spirochaetales bacterium]|nr:motility associated factor glycosyltransferase family protein [Spirochaetales bacterium]
MLQTDPGIRERNYQVLRHMFHDFDKDILILRTDSPRLKTGTAANGELMASYNEKAVCSRHNPGREAARIIETGISSSPGCIVVVYGGLGHRLKALRNRYPHVPLVVVEPDVSLFLEILDHVDLSTLLAEGGITLLLGASPETVLTVLGDLHFMGNLEVLVHRGFADADNGTTELLTAKLAQFSSRKEVNTNTMKRFGKIWLKNLFENVPEFSQAGSLHQIFKSMSDIPALVLAAGPSLDLLIPYIKDLRRRCVIIAVDTAVSWCRLHDIQPDFLIVIDPQYWNTRHLDRLPWHPVLISESSTHPRVFRLHNGPRFFCSSLFPLGRFLDRMAGITGELGAGGSVSTSAWDFARYLTKGPVYIAGLDLCFPGLQTHYRGSFFEERAHVLSNKTHPAATAHFHALVDGNPFLEKNNSGGLTLTDRRLIVYKWWFENQLAARQNEQSFTLSPGAIAIQGLPYKPAAAVLEEKERRDEIDASIGNIADCYHKRLPAVVDIRPLIDGLKDVQRSAAAGASLAKSALAEAGHPGGNPGQAGFQSRDLYDRLERVDAELKASAYKDIAGFLLQEIESELSTCNDPVKSSLILYSHLVDSLDYQIKLLSKRLSLTHKNQKEG